MNNDAVCFELDLLARLLETNGYALEVNYEGATITVWTEVWPIQLRVVRKQATDESESIKNEGEDRAKDKIR